MPIYEYKCDDCENVTEYIESINYKKRTQIKLCPICHYGLLEKIDISKTTFKLKGEGWYSDGYSKQ